ncbi:MAG TPA: SDR family NAD(P)-dependent oxidoreductase [Ignavibacteria bacterium]|nr:SDR family NAD(P)-dependent oxidoreductase [Ignavibacteria bacterium]
MRLKNKIALITGATSGIGKDCAELFASKKMRLILTGRRLDRLTALKKEIIKKHKTDVHILNFDVRKYTEVKKAITSLPNKYKNIEILINNAGLSRGLNKLQDGVLDDWEEMIDTNVKGLLYVTKEVLKVMTKNNSGHIVNIGSIAGHEVYPAGNVYCATKHAVDALTKGLRMDLNGTNIKVSTIDPGLVETEFSIVRFRGDHSRAKKVYEGFTPLNPKDVADAVLYSISKSNNVVVAEMILLPIAQASSAIVNRV